ncbi:unnamed protein product [Sphagnum tenellum]
MMIDGQGLIIELLGSSPAPDLYAGGKAAALALQQACLLLFEGLVMFMLLYQQKCDRSLFSCNDDVTYRSVCPSVEETLMCGGHSDVAISARSGKDKCLAMTWNSYLLCTVCVQEWKCAAMEVFWLLPLNSTQQNVTGSVLSHVLYIIVCGSMNRVIEELIAMGKRVTKVDILGIHTEHLMSIERLIGDKVSNEQGDQDLVGYALPK